jgi:DNA-binding response OmpR family regulator
MARILIIDDEAPVRDILRQMLEREGHEVVDAPDGAIGLKLFYENPTDLIITDILMPEKEGIEIILELRKTAPGVKIIAISGGGRTGKLDVLPIAKSFGALRTLAKPFERQELLEAVREMLGQ